MEMILFPQENLQKNNLTVTNILINMSNQQSVLMDASQESSVLYNLQCCFPVTN